MLRKWAGNLFGDDFSATMQVVYDDEDDNPVSNWQGTLKSAYELETMKVIPTSLGKILLTSVDYQDDHYVASFIGIGNFHPC